MSWIEGVYQEWRHRALVGDDAVDEAAVRRSLGRLYRWRGYAPPRHVVFTDSPPAALRAAAMIRLMFGASGKEMPLLGSSRDGPRHALGGLFWGEELRRRGATRDDVLGIRHAEAEPARISVVERLDREVLETVRQFAARQPEMRVEFRRYPAGSARPPQDPRQNRDDFVRSWDEVWRQLYDQPGWPWHRDMDSARQTWFHYLAAAPAWGVYDSHYYDDGHPNRRSRARRASRRRGGRTHWVRRGRNPGASLTFPQRLTVPMFSGFGCCDPGWLAYGDVLHRLGRSPGAPWEHLVDLARLGVWDCILTWHCAIIVRRLCLVVTDEEGRLHCETGPALAWRDGFRVHAIHQVVVPPEVIAQRDRLTVDVVRAEPNLEVRRALIELYGRRRFLEDSAATVVDSDADASGMPRRLLQVPLQELRAMRYVEVTCPSTGHVHLLQVPPTMASCREAVAWTFDLAPDAYAPLQEA